MTHPKSLEIKFCKYVSISFPIGDPEGFLKECEIFELLKSLFSNWLWTVGDSSPSLAINKKTNKHLLPLIEHTKRHPRGIKDRNE